MSKMMTKEQLVKELDHLRQRVAELEAQRSDLKQPEESQGQAAAHRWSMLDNMLEGCQVIGYDWRHLYVNNAVARHGRRTREELTGRTMMEIYAGIENTEMFAALRRCMELRVPQRMEIQFTFPDGTAGWFELRVNPVPEGILIVSWEVTKRKLAEDALRASEKRYRLLAENVTDVIWATDMDFRCTYVSPSMTALRGYTVAEAAVQSPADSLSPASLRTVTTVLGKELGLEKAGGRDARRSWIVELEMRRRDGSTIWTEN
ncbi:MAG: PAS domain S-box protein, partial [Chloroflexi bacterium]|nr:PAS domain S-box protein [Chloroflexota bacterium]